jgi:UDP-2-acetamido-3-amino-2,3-dideoxy-glucuronate N-acetyltransferase
MGSDTAYFLHESSYVDEGAEIGEGTKIWHFCHIMGGAKIGKKCSIGQNVNIGACAVIGDGVKIQNNVSVYDDVIIEDDVFCGPSCVFTNVINPRAFIERKHEYRKTVVKKGASIGANATIVCGVTIGEYALVGAGSVVTRDVPAYALVYGNPARAHGRVGEDGRKAESTMSRLSISDFTYSSYIHLLNIIIENDYAFAGYHNYMDFSNPCIIRHDIDFDVEKALQMAKIEAERHIQSTYFVLLNTNFYNIFSTAMNKMVKEMAGMGHEIGLHFDEAQYAPSQEKGMVKYIQRELNILEKTLERPVSVVSMHRPSKATLGASLAIPGVTNSYDQKFFQEFKYISDSRHSWREDATAIICSKEYKRLHILTHPVWYTKEKMSCRDKLFSFITSGNMSRYRNVNDNFRDLDEFVRNEEIE